MSLEPHWFSTIYGMLFMIIGALTAMSFVIFVLRKLSDYEPLRGAVTAAQFNDLGNLMLAFVMLWAYLSYSQFLIIWAGNLKEEIPWYMTRAFGGWGAVAVILMVLHFAVPFLLLLQSGVKRRLARLSFVAGMLIVLSLVDVYWLVVPAFERMGPECMHRIFCGAWNRRHLDRDVFLAAAEDAAAAVARSAVCRGAWSISMATEASSRTRRRRSTARRLRALGRERSQPVQVRADACDLDRGRDGRDGCGRMIFCEARIVGAAGFSVRKSARVAAAAAIAGAARVSI